MSMREAFEARMRKSSTSDLTINRFGNYRSTYVQNKWNDFQAGYQAALAAQAQQESQWISVEERLPDSIREVIGAYWHEEIGRFQQIFCCYDADDDDEWISYGDATPYPIRYWMESPPAPEGDKE